MSASRDLLREGSPLSQRSQASLLVNLSGDKMALHIEVVSDLIVNRTDFLQRLHTSKPLHRSFASSKRLMRILRPIVEATTYLVPIRNSDLVHCRRISPKRIGDDDHRSAVFLHEPLEKL